LLCSRQYSGSPKLDAAGEFFDYTVLARNGLYRCVHSKSFLRLELAAWEVVSSDIRVSSSRRMPPNTGKGRERCINSMEIARINGRALILKSALCTILVLCCKSMGAQSVTGPNWNPPKGPAAGAKYAGEKVCAGCHVQEARTYMQTPMAKAGEFPSNDEILKAHPRLEFQLGPYHYLIVLKNDRGIYSVSDGKKSISEPIVWVFGKSVVGQTYILRYHGAYYQSRVSFFNETQSLGITPGDPFTPSKTLKKAFGDRLNQGKAQSCIACHVTGAVVGGIFQPRRSVPGVGCEACHGPGARHVAEVQHGKPAAREIFNPARLAPNKLDDFCGSCHRTWEQVKRSGLLNVNNVRFEPYRLEKSACWRAMDARISCLACHNPHEPLVERTGFYDAKCLACHLEKGVSRSLHHTGKACPVSTHGCITCHMPRYELPGSRHQFVDHDIRIVRADQPYPG
jgi:Cytochrome c554 and c-prime